MVPDAPDEYFLFVIYSQLTEHKTEFWSFYCSNTGIDNGSITDNITDNGQDINNNNIIDDFFRILSLYFIDIDQDVLIELEKIICKHYKSFITDTTLNNSNIDNKKDFHKKLLKITCLVLFNINRCIQTEKKRRLDASVNNEPSTIVFNNSLQ